jgi:hypothetical protein
MMQFCHSCNNIFAVPSRRGRPPKYCKTCAESENVAASDRAKLLQRKKERAEARIDRLEIMLKGEKRNE